MVSHPKGLWVFSRRLCRLLPWRLKVDKRTRWKVAGWQASALLLLAMNPPLPVFRLLEHKRKK